MCIIFKSFLIFKFCSMFAVISLFWYFLILICSYWQCPVLTTSSGLMTPSLWLHLFWGPFNHYHLKSYGPSRTIYQVTQSNTQSTLKMQCSSGSPRLQFSPLKRRLSGTLTIWQLLQMQLSSIYASAAWPRLWRSIAMPPIPPCTSGPSTFISRPTWSWMESASTPWPLTSSGGFSHLLKLMM